MLRRLLLAIVAASAATAVVAAAASPAASPLVATPFGWRARECVLRVPDGARIEQVPLSEAVLFQGELASNDDHAGSFDPNVALRVQVASKGQGAGDAVPEATTTTYHRVPLSCHADMHALTAARDERHRRRMLKKESISISSDSDNNNTVNASATVPEDGWYDNAYIWHYTIDEHIYDSFDSTVTVPRNPRLSKDQILYYFIGLENMGYKPLNILQPVLTFGQTVQGAWSVASWACCPANITVQSTPIIGLETGDKIKMGIRRVNESTWRVDSTLLVGAAAATAATTAAAAETAAGFTSDSIPPSSSSSNNNNSKPNATSTTLIAQVGNFPYNYADVTLEVYNIKSCDEMAPGAATFDSLVLVDQHGAMQGAKIPWQLDVGGQGCNGRIAVDPQTGNIDMQ